VNPADRQHLLDQLERDGFVKNVEAEMRRRDGSTFWALISATVVTLDGHRSILAMYHDISDRKAADAALLDSEVRYALISRAANDGLWDWDIPSGVVFYSSRWKEIVDGAPGDRFNCLEDWLVRVHAEDVGRLRRDIDRHVAGETAQLDTEYRIRRSDGSYAWMSCRGIALRDGGGTPIRMAGSQTDITLRKSYELTLRSAAYRDGLTGLNNRAYFNEVVDARPTAADITNTALILINLDRFRRLNDSLGTAAGDAVLIALAKRLSACASTGDIVARLGSDEFAFWFSNIADQAAIRVEADALITELSRPVLLGDLEVPMPLSLGMATPGQGDAASGADMLRNARLALDHARALGGGRIELFDEVLLRETRLRQRLSTDLTSAHRLGQIFFDYQPVIELESGRVAGFEALMRWRHPELGAISPATFIPIAEDAGLIGKLGQFAIESAARQIDIWTREGLIQGEFSVAVNLSARQISDRVGIARLLALLDRLALPSGRLKLELTESVLMQDPEAMAPALQKFRDRGVELSLDDFGTGYSSLSYLHRFALDVLKIDRSFISRMLVAPEAYRLVRSIIDLAHDLGLKVVAEGVEVADEVASLKALGCDFAQGFFFSRPIPPDQAAALLLKQSN
jgi:diguanylate cyclase (GGDEF)-like protein/PAS domain S-box-containing protein